MGIKGRWAQWLERLEGKAPRVHRFLTSTKKPYPMAREATFFAAFIFLGAALLWGTTGQPLGDSPVVVVESGSMMHCANGVGWQGSACQTERYGRIGTIDPGDLVFVRDIDRAKDIHTLAASGDSHYGKAGDVIIFRPDGDRLTTPIIHRALFYLEIHDDGGGLTFTIPELVDGPGGERFQDMNSLDEPLLQSMGLKTGYANDLRNLGAGPEDSGFITRGDNNRDADQDPHGNIADFPVKAEWVLGKARGEVPWLGLVKLKFSDWFAKTDNYAAAPSDSKSMLLISLAVLLGGPYVIEKVVKSRRQRKAQETAHSESVAIAAPDEAPAEPGNDLDDGPPTERGPDDHQPRRPAPDD